MRNQKGLALRWMRLCLCVVLMAAQMIPALPALAEDTAMEAAQPAQDAPPMQDIPLEPEGGTIFMPGEAPPTPPEQDMVFVPEEEPQPAPVITQPPSPEPPAPTEAPPVAEVPPPAEEAPLPVETPGGWARQDDAPMDVRAVLEAMGHPPGSLIDGLSVAFTQDGQMLHTPTESADIALTLHLRLPPGVAAQLRQDDWYAAELPGTVTAAGMQAGSFEQDETEYARMEVDGGLLRIQFMDAVRRMDAPGGAATVHLAFVPGAYAPGEIVTLSLPGVEASGVTFTMADGGASSEADFIWNQAEGILDTGEAEEGEGGDDAPVRLSARQLVTGFSLAYTTPQGDPADAPAADSLVRATLNLAVPDAVKAQLTEGSTYTIVLPDALRIAREQTADLPGLLASARVDTDKTVTLTFAVGAKDLPAQRDMLSFDAGFDPAVVAGAGTYTLSIADEALAPSVTVTLSDAAVALADAAWTRPEGGAPMDVKDIFASLGLSPRSIISGVHLVYQEPGGGEESEESASVDAAIDFALSIHIPQAVAENIRQGDTYVMDLPPEIKVDQGGTYPIYGPDGVTSYATATVGTDGGVRFVFNDNIRQLGQSQGEFHFSASFNQDHINTPGDHVIPIPGESQDLSIRVNILSRQAQSLDKQGQTDKTYNPGSITWNVDFNKPLQTLSGAVLSDTLPDGLTLEGIEVYRIGVDLGGNVIPGSETQMDASEYSADLNTGTVTFSGNVDHAVRVRYVTRITGDTDAGGDLNFVNNATLTASGMDTLNTSATVTARYGKFIDKTNSAYDPLTQTFTWQIRYNYGQQAIGAGEAALTDTLTGAGMVYDPNSVRVQRVSIGENGTPSISGDLAEGEYSVSIGGTQMQIGFPQGLSDAVLITYTTHIEGIVDSSGVEYRNNVSTTWGEHTHATGAHKPTQQQNIIKSVHSVDEVNQQVTWTVRINRSRYMMRGWSMTDQLGDGQTISDGQLGLLGLVDITGGGTGSLALHTDYEVVRNSDRSFTVRFLGDLAAGTDHEYELVFYSGYGDTDIQTLTNQATGVFTDDQGQPHTSTSSVSYPRTPLDIDGGQKFGIYNAVTKEITWSILVNYHQRNYRPAVLTDPIKGNQQYIHNSLQVYNAPTGQAGDLTGTPIDPGALGLTVQEPSQTNNQTLTVSFPSSGEGDVGSFWIVFRTSLADQVVEAGSAYANDAAFQANGRTHTLHGDVSVNHGGELLSKSGRQSGDGYVHWTAIINPSQSTLHAPTLTDTPSENQRIDMGSLVFYRTQVDEGGNILTDASRPLGNGEYTAAYAQNDQGVWVLTVHFPGTLSTPLVMQYRASVYLTEETGTVSNHVTLVDQNGTQPEGGGTTGQLPVRVYQGGGTIYGQQGAVTVRKLGAGGQPLPGAVLVLEDAGGNRIGPVTVGAGGEVTFSGIVQGTYTLWELSAPEGYTVSQALAAGMEVVVDGDTTSGARVVEVPNERTRASLRKVNESGGPLSGAVFRLERMENGAFVSMGNETYTSQDNGMVIVEGLLPGTYRFVEVTPPQGYLPNPQPREFTLAAGENGVIPAQDTGDFINYRASVRVFKTDETGNPLAGAVFTVTGAGGAVLGEYTTDATGYAVINDLGPGTYQLVETRAPIGYAVVSDPQTISIEGGAGGSVPSLNITVENAVAFGAVVLRKVDGDTGISLAGAEFSLHDASGAELLRVTTGPDGRAQIDDLAPGAYTLVETRAPAGYIRNTDPWPFTVPEDADERQSIIDIGSYPNYQSRIRVYKTNEAGEPLAGAVFTLTDADGAAVGAYTTGTNGYAVTGSLAPGTYQLVETRAPIGYAPVTDPQTISIADTAAGPVPDLTLTIENPVAFGAVVLRKADGDTDTGLPGAEFSLHDASGAELLRVTTDANGRAQINDLAPGDYTLIEEAAPAGYIRNTDPWRFTVPGDINERQAILDIGTYNNYQGRARIEKIDENGRPVPGAVFTLYDGESRALRTYTTDANGVIELYRLAPGEYRMKETEAPTGFALTSDPIDFTIPDHVGGVLPALQIGRVQNERQLGVAVLRKVDAQSGLPLAGAAFALINGDTGTEVARVVTGVDGTASVSGLASGRYQFVEVAAPAGYAFSSAPLPFDIYDGAQAAPIELTARNARLPGYTPPVVPWPTVPPWGPPQTGDSGNTPWVMLMALSGIAFLTTLGGLGLLRMQSRKRK